MFERLKIRLNRTLRRMGASLRLRRQDSRPIPARKPGEVWMFLVCKNEELRLPDMLRWHFAQGVSRVLIVDNGSTDRTLDLVRDDPRIHVFQTSQSFAGNKIAWQELLLRRYGVGHWNLVLDADELFVYPDMDSRSLPELADALERGNAQAFHSVFLEMFPKEPISDVRYAPGGSLLQTAPWFDAREYVRVPYRRVFDMPGSDFVYMGGTRARVFGGEFGCSKIPFFKYDPRQFLRLGFHTIEGARLSTGQAAVLHFKYLQDFHGKVIRESSRGVYWNGAAEYKAYAARFEKNPRFSLWHPSAVRFESWRTLADLGLVF